MKFEQALEAMRNGYKVKNHRYKEVFIGEWTNIFKTPPETKTLILFRFDETCNPFDGYSYEQLIKDGQEPISFVELSSGELLAEDWEIVK